MTTSGTLEGGYSAAAVDRIEGPADAFEHTLADGRPVLVFEVDGAFVDDDSVPARRCAVRLIGSVRGGQGPEPRLQHDDDLSAVLILRALSPARLLSSVRELTVGGPGLSLHAAQARRQAGAVTASAPRETHPAVHLDDRELDVLRRLAEGDSTRDIALRLSYSERTVKMVVRDILDKLECRTRAHAVALATRRGLL